MRNRWRSAKPITIQAGFTLVELVVVIVLLGILASTAAPRFFQRADFEASAYANEAITAIRYAQKLAVTSGCKVQVNFNDVPDRFDLYFPDGTDLATNLCGHGRGAAGAPTFATQIGVPFPDGPLPDGTVNYGVPAPKGVGIANDLVLFFDGQGLPSAGGNVVIGSHTLRVEPNSGFAHRL